MNKRYDRILDYFFRRQDLPEDIRRRFERWMLDREDSPELDEALLGLWNGHTAYATDDQNAAGLARLHAAIRPEPRRHAGRRLLRRIAGEKQAAARELCAARFLITGQQYAPAITVEHRRWENLAQALRSCYHQEACGGFNYQRAADEAVDPCLQKLFTRLGERASRRAGEVMELLGCLLC